MFDGGEEPDWLAKLNPEQRAAATHEGSQLLILAGAGTGKTTTLCARVAWLLTQGIPPERILLLTFTRRAAREMVGRARALAERVTGRAGSVVGGTFHSLAHRMVRVHASALGLGRGFGVLDAGDAADLMDFVREEQFGERVGRRFPRAATMIDVYSRSVNAQAALSDVLAESFPWCAEHRDALAHTFRAYTARKRALGVLDLDDLLLYWRALACDGVIGPRMADAFDHVLVDEYQDVNGLQVDIVCQLGRGGASHPATSREDASCPATSRGGASLTAVGDDFQAIYGFRAASARHILEFTDRFPGADTITLERNYRSTSPILAVANAVSFQDRDGYRKRLWTELEGGQPCELGFPRDDGEQAQLVCERVLAAREEGIELRRQAVLFRTGHDSDRLELELSRRGIPFVKYGGLRYLDAAHVKDLIAALRLVENPADEVSWFRLLRLLDGVGPVRARRALDALRPSDGAPPQLIRWPQAAAELPTASRALADALVAALGRAAADTTAAAADRVRLVTDAIGPLVALRYDDGAVRGEDLEQLVVAARDASDLAHFVSELVLDPPSSSADLAGPPHLDEDYLVLSTVHSAKGLEWDAVYLISAYDGNFPADMSVTSREGVAEERRLLYVALTRARRRLHVYVPARFYHRPRGRDDAHGCGQASRFLTAAVQRLFQITPGAERRPDVGTGSARSPAAGPPPRPRPIEISLEGLLR